MDEAIEKTIEQKHFIPHRLDYRVHIEMEDLICDLVVRDGVPS